jgi:hypothetical protein
VRTVHTDKVLRVLGPVALGVGLAALVAGTGAYLSIYPAYADEKARCAGRCDPAQVTALWSRVERAQTAGIALWSVGGALALVGAPLIALTAGARRARFAVAPVIIPGAVSVSLAGVWP